MFRRIILTAALTVCTLTLSAQSSRVKEFKPVCDSLSQLIEEKTSVKGELKLKNIIQRGRTLDFYFTESLGDWPWTAENIRWFKKTLKDLFPAQFKNNQLGAIYSRGVTFDKLATPLLGHDGRPVASEYTRKAPQDRTPLVENLDAMNWPSGLTGRNIAIWQSHGRYFDVNNRRWHWQRPCLFTTTEDLFTQGFVLDFLVPMLENSGAYTMLPRERDTQAQEFIIDNDPHYSGETPRRHGEFKSSGKWETCGTGFADKKAFYEGLDNPFKMGTTLKAKAISTDDKNDAARIEWIPDVTEKGDYSVYVSYQTLPESTEHAAYTVIHNGGESHFSVNQKISGSTWVYLGTFTFAPGAGHKIVLDNRCPAGKAYNSRSIVTADAVKIGGGVGNIARKRLGDEPGKAKLSGLPRYLEGARYWLQWAGIDDEIWSQHEQKNDYKDDFMSRGPWVEYLTGGSDMNPKMKGKGIPVDLSFALHSDAGIAPEDTTVGTLAIYTYKSDNKTVYPDGESRMTSREYAELVQSQLVNDIRACFDTTWNRRWLWDRYYNESRRPSCPAMLLEFLSHQNFADMKYGLDPSFRFTVGRSIYKGILKYLSNRYGLPYAVQPLPIHDFSMSKVQDEDILILKWRSTEDRLEPTATPDGFILETRTGNRSFDKGKVIKATMTQDGIWLYPVRIKKGEVYSFRVRAWNAGGKSFPSESLSAGIPTSRANDVDQTRCTDSLAREMVLIVNNFDRVSAPVWFDTPGYAGFDANTDRGVAYGRDITYMGDMYEFRRDKPWVTNDNSGFGACYRNYTGKTVAGNTFDYPALHGESILKSGRPFISTSGSAFASDKHSSEGVWAIDMICGKQVTTISSTGQRAPQYTVFTEEMQERITRFCKNGGHLLISGANVATDIWDEVYPIEKDSIFTEVSKKFAREILGFSWGGNHAGRDGSVVAEEDEEYCTEGQEFRFYTEPNPIRYSVESPDGILPARRNSKTVFRYGDTEVSAGIRYRQDHYKTVVLGFPIETLKDKKEMEDVITTSLDWFASPEE